jgi:hypothetical protein
MSDFGGQPFPTDLERDIFRWSLQDPCAQAVAEVIHRRHGDRVGDPYERDRYREVDPEHDGERRRRYHLERHRDERHEQADGERAGNGAAVQVPQIGIVQQPAEEPQVFVIPDLVAVGQVTSNDFFRHRRLVVSRARKL